MRIQLLDEQLANQIAAGEVIERPASVVKELVENSLDAKATQINVDIEDGGQSLIRLRDNGLGISREDLPMTVLRHATSKIKSFNDLELVLSLGFRGEALASIAAVSRLKITSCERSSDHGYSIDNITSDGLSSPAPAAHPPGTTVEIRDLFYNTPARRKFLRTVKTEFDHISNVLHRLALGHFAVGFQLKHNQKESFTLPIASELRQQERRVAEVLSQDFIDNALHIEFVASGLQLTGWIALPHFTRGQADMQYCYINGRFVRDKLMTHAVKQGYHDVLFHGRQPAYVLYLTIDPQQVDVNVHPTKHEVRFRDSRTVHEFIFRGVRDALAECQPNAREVQQSLAEPLQPIMQRSSHSAETYSETPSAPPRQATFASFSPVERPTQMQVQEQMQSYSLLHTPLSEPQFLGYALGQLHNIYILAQNEQGLVMVDMHAAHERVLYENLKAQLASQRIEVQPLLIPLAINLSAQELIVWQDCQQSLAAIGFDTEQSGPSSLLVRAVPVLLQQAKIEQLLRDVLSEQAVMDNSRHVEHAINALLGTMACRAAIWAKHDLTIPEMNALLRQMEQTPHSGYCNHGRPTTREFSLQQLDKLFLRGQ